MSVLTDTIPIRRRRSLSVDRMVLGELCLVAALVAVAGVIRWPDYLYIPAFTDETKDVTRAALIAHGRLTTVVDTVSDYNSALFNYLVAGLFVLIGPYLHLPRLLVVVVGSLTTVAAYLLGREWGGRLAGLLAAVLVAANPV